MYAPAKTTFEDEVLASLANVDQLIKVPAIHLSVSGFTISRMRETATWFQIYVTFWKPCRRL